MELYYGIIFGIILQKDIMELYYGIIFMNRIPGMPGTSLETPGIPGIPWARPLGPPGTPLGPPGDAPRIPRGPLGTPMHDKKAISQLI